jgi:dihydrodipicolinate synthase/N-acetylneuraminate lyase
VSPRARARFPACVLATVVVPWTERFELDEDLFAHEVGVLQAAAYRDLYVFGTAGEGYAVTDAQFRSVVSIFAHAMHAAMAEPMVGIISLSLGHMIERIELAQTLGVRRFQISLPSWGALDDTEVRTFFDIVLGRFPDAQFLHYNLLRTQRLVTPAEYAAVAADHPNLVATKNSTDAMTRIRSLLEHAPMLQHFLNERGFLYGSLIGECGLLISSATANLSMGQRYFAAGCARDAAALIEMEAELAGVAAALQASVPGDHIDGAYDKVLWKLHDRRFPLRLLPPYQGAPDDAADVLGAVLRERFPRWAA